MTGLSTIDLTDEATFQRMVVEVARIHGWRVAHFGKARTVRGRTITPTMYDAAGFPDLVLAHPEGAVMFRELKTDKGRLSPEQTEWLALLFRADADVGTWRPKDWTQIVAQLRRKASA